MREFFTEGIIHCWNSDITTWNPTTTSRIRLIKNLRRQKRQERDHKRHIVYKEGERRERCHPLSRNTNKTRTKRGWGEEARGPHNHTKSDIIFRHSAVNLFLLNAKLIADKDSPLPPPCCTVIYIRRARRVFHCDKKENLSHGVSPPELWLERWKKAAPGPL